MDMTKGSVTKDTCIVPWIDQTPSGFIFKFANHEILISSVQINVKLSRTKFEAMNTLSETLDHKYHFHNLLICSKKRGMSIWIQCKYMAGPGIDPGTHATLVKSSTTELQVYSPISTVHIAGPNTTTEIRFIILSVHFCNDNVHDERF